MSTPRTLAEKAQQELNKILKCSQTMEEFNAAVDDRLARMTTKPVKKERRKLSVNQKFFKSL